jgi:uroporphyrinogen decarboxylase
MNKRDTVLSLCNENSLPPYTPAAFFLHFDPGYQCGQAAINKHLEFFRFTGMDILKIQYEHKYPDLPEIRRPEDWRKMPVYKKDFFDEPLKVVEGLVKESKKDALVVVTLYSPFMCAGHAIGNDNRDKHIQENPGAIKIGMEAITESVLNFVHGCIDLGVDGFYASTQGGEKNRFPDISLFNECVKPYDLNVMREINQKCIFNILHICDYNLPYRDLTSFLDYPGHLVNCSLAFDGDYVTPKSISKLFNRPFMGGMERKGILATGTPHKIENEVLNLLKNAPKRVFLAADCTVPSNTPWENLRSAIETAHRNRLN